MLHAHCVLCTSCVLACDATPTRTQRTHPSDDAALTVRRGRLTHAHGAAETDAIRLPDPSAPFPVLSEAISGFHRSPQQTRRCKNTRVVNLAFVLTNTFNCAKWRKVNWPRQQYVMHCYESGHSVPSSTKKYTACIGQFQHYVPQWRKIHVTRSEEMQLPCIGRVHNGKRK